MDNLQANRAPVWPVSLLWPPEHSRDTVVLSAATMTDLALDHIVRALDETGRYERMIRSVLCEPCRDPAVISYRQDILADLLTLPELTAALREVLPEIQLLRMPAGPNWPGESPLGTVVTRLRELDLYVHCIDRLHAILDSSPGIGSAGLQDLRAGARALAADRDVVALRAELPAFHETIGKATSVTIGLNLGRDLQPESATIVELNRFPFRGPRSLLGRLLPGSTNGHTPGLTPLHHAGTAPIRRDSQLFKDLQHLLEGVTAPLVKALARYREVNTGALAALEGEFAWWTGAVALIERLHQAGLSLCRPEIAPVAECICQVQNATNVSLALQMLDRLKT